MNDSDHDLLIKLNVKMEAVLDVVEKVNEQANRIQKLEDRPIPQQPCSWFTDFKQVQEDKDKEAKNFKLWLIGLSVASGLTFVIGVGSILATLITG